MSDPRWKERLSAALVSMLLGCASTGVHGRDNFFGYATQPWVTSDHGPCDVRSVPRDAFHQEHATRYVILGFRAPTERREEADLGRKAASALFSLLRDHLAGVAGQDTTAAAERATLARQIEVVRLSCVAGDDETAREVGLAMGADLVLWGESSAPLPRPPGDTVINYTQQMVAKSGGTVVVGRDQTLNTSTSAWQPFKDPAEGSYRVHAALTTWDLPAIKSVDDYSPASQVETTLDLSRIVGSKPYDLIVFVAGLHFYQQGEYSRAMRFFRRVSAGLRSDGAGGPPLRQMMGNAELRVGRFNEAVMYFQEGLATTQRGSASWWKLSLSLLEAQARAGRTAEANQLADGLLAEVSGLQGDDDAHGFALNELAGSLSELRRHEEALAAGLAAVELRRRLAAARPQAFEPSLAASLNDASIYLGALERRKEALQLVDEATGLYQRLAGARPGTFDAELALALHNRSIQLAGLGKRKEALEDIRRSVEICRRLAEARPEMFQADLASSLSNLSVRLGELDRREKALAAIDEAVGMYQRLARSRPDLFQADLARSLSTRSSHLGALHKPILALGDLKEAARLYRQLALGRAEEFEPRLAFTLSDLSALLVSLDRHGEALEAARESVELLRRWTRERPGRFDAELAMALNNLSLRLVAAGQLEEALRTSEQAVERYERLAELKPGTHAPALAAALNNRSVWLGALGRKQEALAAIQKVVEIRRRLAKARPRVYDAGLATSLANLSVRLSDCQRHQEALVAIQESVSILRGLANAAPAASGPDLIVALGKLSSRLRALNRQAEADDAKAEAIVMARRLGTSLAAPDNTCTPGTRVPCHRLNEVIAEAQPVNSHYVQAGSSRSVR